MRVYELHTEIYLAAPIEEVFEFFADAGNLQALTPPWLDFAIETPRPIRMAVDALIDYRLRVHGLPLRWRTAITAWEPPHRFVDEQVRGPYRLWVHEHRFVRVDDSTRVSDHVRYAVPGGPLAPLVHRLLVRRDVERIFAFRTEQLRARFGTAAIRAGSA